MTTVEKIRREYEGHDLTTHQICQRFRLSLKALYKLVRSGEWSMRGQGRRW